MTSTPETKLNTLIKNTLHTLPVIGEYGRLIIWVSTTGLRIDVESDSFRTAAYAIGGRLDNTEGKLTLAQAKRELIGAIPEIVEQIRNDAADRCDKTAQHILAALEDHRQTAYEKRRRAAGLKTVTVRLDAEAADALDVAAVAHGGDKSAAIRAALKK